MSFVCSIITFIFVRSLVIIIIQADVQFYFEDDFISSINCEASSRDLRQYLGRFH
ncbi:hypothetical protein I4U23_005853 [Adineta vaga]|nr:hypothetical protein I4U23_005853 [Adineta vaga]